MAIESLQTIPALLPRAAGHQFVLYGDCCSGIPGRQNGANFAAVNAVLRRLRPAPEFISFLGDHIGGSIPDAQELRRQWRYWLSEEMAWLDPHISPLYHLTSNHNTYDIQSESIWRETFADIPGNGPPDQQGLAYFVRRGDLLLVAVNTAFSGLGGSGYVEHVWLDQVLRQNADARYKVVMGHHPVHPVNGYGLYPQWRIVPGQGEAFWEVLVRHGVLAYLCSHIIAFDVQVHQGVLQITSGGAGTIAGPGGFMPGATEYLHLVQGAIDAAGLRYQVLDSQGQVREWLAWPLASPAPDKWEVINPAISTLPLPPNLAGSRAAQANIFSWRFSGLLPESPTAADQTLLSGWNAGDGPPTIWVGFPAGTAALTVILLPETGKGAEFWHGPRLDPGNPFDFQIALHTGMGPGGVLWRPGASSGWTSLSSLSARGAETLAWPARWSLGHSQSGAEDKPFRGEGLRVLWQVQATNYPTTDA
ncbi:MAG: hypothetical protein EXR62_12260 [Chloroflexi bacterium]|nr:hypothetical protein [Chloroflexota bacterium]